MRKRLILIVILLSLFVMAFTIGGRAPNGPRVTQAAPGISAPGQAAPGGIAPRRMPAHTPRILPTAPDDFPYPIETEPPYPYD